MGERDAATKWLEEQVKEVEVSEGQGFSLAADDERTLCATVTCVRRPSPPHRRWRVDKDFNGFTPCTIPRARMWTSSRSPGSADTPWALPGVVTGPSHPSRRVSEEMLDDWDEGDELPDEDGGVVV